MKTSKSRVRKKTVATPTAKLDQTGSELAFNDQRAEVAMQLKLKQLAQSNRAVYQFQHRSNSETSFGENAIIEISGIKEGDMPMPSSGVIQRDITYESQSYTIDALAPIIVEELGGEADLDEVKQILRGADGNSFKRKALINYVSSRLEEEESTGDEEDSSDSDGGSKELAGFEKTYEA